MTSTAIAGASQVRPGWLSRRPAEPGQPDQPDQARADQDGQRGQAELDVPLHVDRLDERPADQQEGRHDQPRQRYRRGVERAPVVREAGGHDTGQREQGEREHQCPRAGEVGHEFLGRPEVRPGHPGDLFLLAVRDVEQRAEHDHRGRRGGQPAQRYPADPASRRGPAVDGSAAGVDGSAAGVGQQQRHAVRGQDQQPEQVEQAGQRDGGRVRRPPPPPAVRVGPDQQIGGDRGEHRHDRVGPGHLGVVGHVRRGREDHARQQAGQRRDVETALASGVRGQRQGGRPPADGRGDKTRYTKLSGLS